MFFHYFTAPATGFFFFFSDNWNTNGLQIRAIFTMSIDLEFPHMSGLMKGYYKLYM